MAEFKKQISIGVVVALIAAIGVGVAAVTLFPDTPPNNLAAPLLGLLYAQDVTCFLSNASCSMIVVNNSTVGVFLDSCSVGLPISNNGSIFAYKGTIGGQAVKSGIAIGSEVAATCAASPPTYVADEYIGKLATGGFTVSLDSQWYSYPAGSHAGFSFQSNWS